MLQFVLLCYLSILCILISSHSRSFAFIRG
jgi:hypothetical protein